MLYIYIRLAIRLTTTNKKLLKMNTVNVTIENLTGTYQDNFFFVPVTINEKKMVMKINNADSVLDTNAEAKFLNQLEFAIAVTGKAGWDAVDNHLKLNGLQTRVVGCAELREIKLPSDIDVTLYQQSWSLP